MSKQPKQNPGHSSKVNPGLPEKKPVKSSWSDGFIHFLQKQDKKIIIALTIIALGMRLYRLGYLTFWVDEYVHVNRTMEFLKTFKFNHIFGGEKNGILVTISNILGFAIFGKNEFGGRFFIALIGAALVPATYYFCKKLFNIYIGLMVCFFIAFSNTCFLE
jgi:predicted membrane-bound mannosyltransferase